MEYSEMSKKEILAILNEQNSKILELTTTNSDLVFQLQERKKELKCHNFISDVLSVPNLSQSELLEKIIEIIPPSWQFPELTEACIIINDERVTTLGYQPSENEMSAPVFCNQQEVGRVVVGYPGLKTDDEKNNFLAEEQDLLNSIAERIGNYLQKESIEKQKADSEQLYKSIIDTSPDSITITNLEGIIEFTSVMTDSFRSNNPDFDFINRNIMEFVAEKDKNRVAKHIKKIISGKHLGPKEYEGIRTDGVIIPIDVNAGVIKDDQGNPYKLMFLIRNNADRKKVEEKLAASELRLKTMMGNLPGIAYQCLNDEDWTMLFMSKGTKALTGFASKEFTGKKHKSYNDVIHPDDRNYVAQMVDEGIKNKKPYELEYRIIAASGKIKNVWEKGQGIFDDNGKLIYLEGLINDVTKHTRLRSKLEENEKQYRFLVESVGDVVYEISGDGIFKYVSPVSEHIFGYKPEDIIGTKLFDYVYKDDLPILAHAFKTGLNKNYTHLDYRIYNKAGEIRWVRSSTTPIIKNNKLVGGTGTMRDVTEVKMAEIKMQVSERKYRQLFELADDMVFLLDKGQFIDANPSALKALGFKNSQELAGKTPLDLSPEFQPDGQKSADKLLQTLNDAAEKGFTRFEWVFTINNEQRWLDISSTILPDTNNEIAYAVCRDITKAKTAELKLKKSQWQHSQAQKIAHLGHWELDLVTNDLKWSDEIFRLFEIDIDKFGASYDAFLDMIHPEDREMVNAAYENSLKNKQPYDITHRLLMKDGRIKYVREQCHTHFDEKGNPLSSLGTVIDVTKQKLLEQKLREKEQRFEQVTEQSQTVIWEVDKNGLYTYVSPVSEKVWGYKPHELVGKLHYYDLHPEEGRKEFIQATQQAFKKKESFEDLPNRIEKKDGSKITVTTNGSPVLDENQNLKGYRGADNDISLKLKAEEELRFSEQKYRSIFDNIQDAYYEVTPDGIFLEISPSVEILSQGQYKREDIIGSSIRDLYADMDEREKFLSILQEKGRVSDYEIKLKNKDGSIVHSSITASIQFNNKGEIDKIVGTIRDISERKQAEQKIKQSELKYRTIFENIQDTYYEVSMDGKFIEVSPSIKSMTNGELTRDDLIGQRTSEFFCNPKEQEAFINELRTKGSVADYEVTIKDAKGNPKPISITSSVQFDQNGRPVKSAGIMRDISERKQTEEKIRASEEKYRGIFENIHDTYYEVTLDGIISEISPSVKVLTQGQYSREDIIGKSEYSFYRNLQKWEEYNKLIKENGKIIDFENELVNKDGQSIHTLTTATFQYDQDNNPVKIIGTIHDYTARKKAQEELRKSEKRYKSIFSDTQSVMLIIDPKTGIINDANKAACNYYGWNYDEICSKHITEINQLSDEEVQKEMQKAVNERRQHFNFKHKLANGEIRDVESFAGPIEIDSDKKLLSIVHDVTERRNAQEALLKSENNLNNAQVLAGIGRWEFNLETQTHSWSQNMFRIMGLEPNEEVIKEEEFIAKIHPDDRHLFEKKLSKIQNKFSSEFRIKIKNKYRWMQTIVSPVFEGDKVVRIYGTNIDITEKKKAEEQIKSINHRLNAILKALPDLLFIVRKDGTYIDFIASENKDLLLPRDQIIGSNIKDTFQPEQANFMLKKLKECLNNQELTVFDYSFTLNKQELYYEARITPFNKNSVLILTHDITEKKRGELTIRKLSLAVNQSPTIKVITDLEGNIEYVNRAFTTITGYTEEEAIGKNPRILKSGKTDKSVYQDLWKTIKNGKTWKGEWINKRKNGELYWEDVSISPVRNNDGVMTNFLAVKQDITERKKQEEKIWKLNQHLEEKVIERTAELNLKTRELEEFFSVSPDLLCIANLDGKLLKVNSAWEQLLGISRKKIEHKNFINFIHPDDIETTKDAIKYLGKKKEIINFINRYKTKDGEYRFIEWHSILSNNLIYSAAHDVTQKKLKENIESELFDLSVQLSGVSQNEINDSITNALERVGKFIDSDRCYIFEFDEAGNHMNNTFEWCNSGISQEIKNLQNLPTEIFPQWMKTLRNRKNVIIPDVAQLPEEWKAEREILEPQDIQSVLVIPMYIENDLLGFIGIDSVKRKRTFSPYEIQTLNIWVNILSSLINRRNAGDVLEKTRQNYHTFFNTIDDFLFIFDMEGNIVSINNTIINRLGYTQDDLIGKPLLHLHPRERQEEVEITMKKIFKGEINKCSIPLLCKNGEQIVIETKVTRGLWDGQPSIFSVSKDISDIVISEQKFSRAFQSNASLMAIISIKDQTVIDINEMFLKTMEFDRNEVIGAKYFDLDIVTNLNQTSNFLKKLAQNISIREEEVELRTKSGKLKTILLSADTVYIGKEQCLLAVMIDLTQRKKIESDLLLAKSEAEKANKAKSEFLSRMSHELRTPMNSILGFAQLLDMRVTDDKQKKGITRILSSGKHLLGLINEVLEISRIESGRLALSIEPVNLHNLLNEVFEIQQNFAEQMNIKLVVAEKQGVIYVRADKQKLKQVILNLVNNAIKYNKNGGKVTLQPDVFMEQDTEKVKIKITDTGVGITPENLQKLFSPFERIGAEKSDIEGSGLGLAVSKKLTEAMNGQIRVESTPGKGSTFWITLPRDIEFEKDNKAKKQVTNNFTDQNKSTGSILYIEDNESNIELVNEALEMHRPGIQLYIDKTGETSVSLARKIQPDLILLDLNLPGMQGDQILSELKSDKILNPIPVVIISADAMQKQINNLLELGAKEYLTKPIDLNNLFQTVDKYIE